MPSLYPHSTHWESHLQQPSECPLVTSEWMEQDPRDKLSHSGALFQEFGTESVTESPLNAPSQFSPVRCEMISFGWRYWALEEPGNREGNREDQSGDQRAEHLVEKYVGSYGFLENSSPVLLCFKEAWLNKFLLSSNSTLWLKQSLRDDFLKTLGEPTDSLERHSGWIKAGSLSETCMRQRPNH